MQRLLWKEFREKRIWFLLLPLISLVSEWTGRGFPFIGDLPSLSGYLPFPFSLLTLWLIVPVPFALLMGFTTYSSELKSGVAQFLYSRPASWKQILAGKLAVGLGVVLISTAAAFTVYMIQYPQDYASFAVPSVLLAGIGRAFLILLTAYVIGVSCSVLLPGLIGGMLVLLAILLVALAQFEILVSVGVQAWIATGIAWFIGLIAAAIVVVRFGLTLSNWSRVTRYAISAAVVVVCISPIDFLMPRVNSGPQITNISPDGKYAVAATKYYNNWWLVRLTDDKRTRLKVENSPDQYKIRWIGSGTLILKGWGEVTLFDIDEAGGVSKKVVPLTAAIGDLGDVEPSPDGDLLAVSIPTGTQNYGEPRMYLEFVDVRSARKIYTTIKRVESFMWISNTQVHYADMYGHQHTITVLE